MRKWLFFDKLLCRAEIASSIVINLHKSSNMLFRNLFKVFLALNKMIAKKMSIASITQQKWLEIKIGDLEEYLRKSNLMRGGRFRDAWLKYWLKYKK